jgi:hypothetical protein
VDQFLKLVAWVIANIGQFNAVVGPIGSALVVILAIQYYLRESKKPNLNAGNRYGSPENMDQDKLLPPTASTEDLVQPGLKEVRARSRYLKDLRLHVENLLQESIHNARFLDLGVTDCPVATAMPWLYKNSSSTQTFGTVSDALSAYENRLLLLGAPGSGKSTALLQIGLDLVAKAELDPTAAIPLIFNLSKFQFNLPAKSLVQRILGLRKVPSVADLKFDHWLIGELTSLYGVSRRIASRWVGEGKVAALLDGLDEVSDDRRADMVKLLNRTYVSDYRNSILIVCSRISEYLPLQDDPETLLQLRGAITLESLSPVQVDEYLKAADAPGLAQAIGSDASLAELAQTPLTLSMMTLAFGGRAAKDIPSFPSLAEMRHYLIETFVSRMLQRKERRDRQIPFDEDTQKNVKEEDYRYSPQKACRYFCWLAIHLSLRMQTACSLSKLYTLISRAGRTQDAPLDRWPVRLSRLLPLTFLTLVALPMISSRQTSAWRSIEAIAVITSISLAVVILNDIWPQDRDWGETTCSLFIAGISLGALSVAVSSLVPGHLPPAPTGIIVFCSCLTLLTSITAIRKDEGLHAFLWIEAVTFILLLGLIVGLFPNARETGLALEYVAAAAVASQIIAGCAVIFRESSSTANAFAASVVALATVLILILIQTATIWALGSLNWFAALLLFGIVMLFTSVRAGASSPRLVGTAFVAAIGGYAGGIAGSIVATAFFWLGVVILWIADQLKLPGTGRMVLLGNRLAELTRGLMEEYALGPTSRLALAATGHLPWQLRGFLRYGGEALILKPFHLEIEFAHRRLRDHFALRELVPQLKDNSQRRTGAIRALGFQGDAAIETLAELSRNGTPEERELAISALSHISAPDVAAHLRQAMLDPEPSVRASVLRGLRNRALELRTEVFKVAAGDESFLVQKTLVDEANVSVTLGDPIGAVLAAHEGNQELLTHFVRQLRMPRMQKLPPWTEPALRQFLADKDAEVRAGTCWLAAGSSLIVDPPTLRQLPSVPT